MRSPFHMSLEGFVVGIGVAIAQSKGILLSQKRAKIGFAVCAAFLATWLGSHDFLAEITRFDVWLQPGLLSITFGLMVWCAASLPDREPACEPFFRVNARLSYSLYLVHLPLIPFAVALAQNLHFMDFWVFYLLLSYAAALILHFVVEKPFLNLKQRATKNEHGFVSMGQAKATIS